MNSSHQSEARLSSPPLRSAKPRHLSLAIGKIQVDESLFPRDYVDSRHVERLAEAIESGADLPRIVVGVIADSHYILVDGRHRMAAYRLIYGAAKVHDRIVQVECRAYGARAELLLDAIRLNAEHGLGLSDGDIKRCVKMAGQLSIDPAALASALSLRVERLPMYGPTVEKARDRPAAGRQSRAGEDQQDRPLSFNDRDQTPKASNPHQAALNALSMLVAMFERGEIDPRDEAIRYWTEKLAAVTRPFKK